MMKGQDPLLFHSVIYSKCETFDGGSARQDYLSS